MCKEVSHLTEDVTTLVNRVLRMKAEQTSATQEFVEDDNASNNIKVPKLKIKLAYIEDVHTMMLELLSLTEVSILLSISFYGFHFYADSKKTYKRRKTNRHTIFDKI